MHISRWFLLRTKTGSEQLAQENLQRQGYGTYCPMLKRRRRIFGKWQKQIVPLFPGYLFLDLHLGEQALSPVKSTKGVVSIVKFGSEYAVVPARIVAALRTRAEPRTGVHVLEERRLVPRGRVRVTAGSLFGLEGIFVRECGDDRVVVLLNLLGQETPVKVEESLVEALA